MGYYGFSAAQYLPSMNQAYATKQAGVAQLGTAIGAATQTVGQAIAQRQAAIDALNENKALMDEGYKVAYQLAEEKLLAAKVDKDKIPGIIHSYMPPITPLERKYPEKFVDRKNASMVKLNDYAIKIAESKQIGQDVQRLTEPQWQPTGTEQPQQALGQGPIAQSVQQSGMGGFITGETQEPQAQTPTQLQAGLAAKGYAAEEAKPFVETLAKQEAAGVAQQRETRLREQQEEQQELRVQKFEQEKKEFNDTMSRLKKAESRQHQQLAANYFQKNPTPEKAKATLEKVEGLIAKYENGLKAAKENKASAVAQQIQGTLDYYKDIKRLSEESLRNATKMSMYLAGSGGTGGGLGAQPPTEINAVKMKDPETGKVYMVNQDTNEVLYEVFN